MDTRNENCGLPYVRCYYPHRSRDSLSPVCGIFCGDGDGAFRHQTSIHVMPYLFDVVNKITTTSIFLCVFFSVNYEGLFVKLKGQFQKLCQMGLFQILQVSFLLLLQRHCLNLFSLQKHKWQLFFLSDVWSVSLLVCLSVSHGCDWGRREVGVI